MKKQEMSKTIIEKREIRKLEKCCVRCNSLATSFYKTKPFCKVCFKREKYAERIRNLEKSKHYPTQKYKIGILKKVMEEIR